MQELLDRWLADGLDPSTIKNTLDPLRVIYRRAMRRDELAVNPTADLELPRSKGRRARIAGPDEARALLGALPDGERPQWATAMYAGLRRGELRALRAGDVDLERDVINVCRGWDDDEGEIDPKSYAGTRTVPIPRELRAVLAAHKLASGRRDDDLLFGRTASAAFVPTTVRSRALKAWQAAELEPINLHEARHTYASLMIAAGVNAKALCAFMGHSSIAVT